MAGHPYTDEQVKAFARALGGSWPGCTELRPNSTLADLTAAGIEVKFPAPRYYVARGTDSILGTPGWFVRDRCDGANVAWFYSADAEQYAREHADRRNRERSDG